MVNEVEKAIGFPVPAADTTAIGPYPDVSICFFAECKHKIVDKSIGIYRVVRYTLETIFFRVDDIDATTQGTNPFASAGIFVNSVCRFTGERSIAAARPDVFGNG